MLIPALIVVLAVLTGTLAAIYVVAGSARLYQQRYRLVAFAIALTIAALAIVVAIENGALLYIAPIVTLLGAVAAAWQGSRGQLPTARRGWAWVFWGLAAFFAVLTVGTAWLLLESAAA